MLTAQDWADLKESIDRYVIAGDPGALKSFLARLLAQARVDALEEAAKICDARAEWLHSNMHALKAEQSETLAEAIRARKDSGAC